MKRYNNLYEKIYNYDNLLLAHKNARKGKLHYREVKTVDKDSEKFLLEIQRVLKENSYKTSEYKIEEKVERNKKRVIYKLPYYPDRIVHHAIMNIMNEKWVKTLIKDTYQSIKGRGIHLAANKIKKILKEDRENTKYCLKLDIKKFYPSVDNKILKRIIRKKIKDQNLLNLLDEIIDSSKGIPIGNYLSQIFGNLYLGEFDHWIKEVKRIKYYFRYCDDCVILLNSKEELHKLKIEIDDFLLNRLKLEIKENWQIFPIDVRGIDYLGYRFFHNYTLLRKNIVKDFKRKINKIEKNWESMNSFEIINSVVSYYGWFKIANSYSLKKKFSIDKILFLKSL